jgi:DNA modification methylase
MLTLNGQKSALWSAWRRKDQSYYQHAIECRAVGQHWISIKELITARRKAGDKINAEQWARTNAPCSKRWLDMYAEFANRWEEFEAAWKWAQALPYSIERRPGLHSLFDLMVNKKRFDTYSKVRKDNYRGLGKKTRASVGNSSSQPIETTAPAGHVEILTALNKLCCGDVVDVLKAHVADGGADLVIADPPYYLSRYTNPAPADYFYAQAGMTPRFDQEWDKFDGLKDYEQHAERWLLEIMRCLNSEGSAFIFGSFHNSGPINRLCQLNDYHIINEIVWVQRNGRPNAVTATLQHSHQNVLWIAKDRKNYRFNYRECKQKDYFGDFFSERGKQKRDVWDIPANPHENKAYGHPSPKPLAVYNRILDVAGKPGGLVLDLFSGSGTGAVSTMKWGMEALSIEREPKYCEMIRRRVANASKEAA